MPLTLLGYQNRVNDVDNSVGGLDVGDDYLRFVDGHGPGCRNRNGDRAALNRFGRVERDNLLGRHRTGDDVVKEEVGQGWDVLEQVLDRPLG